MPQITLRAACEADADAMLKIYTPYVACTRASWEYEPPSADAFAARVLGHLADGFPWLLAEEEGAVLGYAYAGRLGERRGYDWDAETAVYLSAAAHRRRIGTALYTALLALLRAQGYVNCYALVTNPNPPSEAFHRRMGFAVAAHLPGAGYKQGQWVGLFYFHKALCAPPAQPLPPVPLCALDGAQTANILKSAALLCAGAERVSSSAAGPGPKPAAPLCPAAESAARADTQAKPQGAAPLRACAEREAFL